MTPEHVRSILRLLDDRSKLNILVLGITHERYESQLCKTGHNFHVLKINKDWNTKFADIPENYFINDNIRFDIDYDLILCHTSYDINFALELKEKLNIPIIRHTHTLPYNEQEKKDHKIFKDLIDFNSFISNYSMSKWGYEYNNRTCSIDHAIDDIFHSQLSKGRDNKFLSVVNLWKSRDWACGWNFYVQATKDIDKKYLRIVGDNPGISEPAPNVEALVREYASANVFINTSQNSPIPMSLLEAMTSGCLVITRNNCGIGKFINGDNGILVDTPEEMNRYIKYFIEHPEEARIMGENAQKTMKKYNMQKFCKEWNDLFNKVIKK